MVVLVDRGTASAAEIVTGALQDRGRAKVVGTHTYGKGVFQEIEPLPNGGALDFTVGEYFTPNGHNLGGGGVAPGRRDQAQRLRLRQADGQDRHRADGGRADRRRRAASEPPAGRAVDPRSAGAGRGPGAAGQVPRRRAVLRSRSAAGRQPRRAADVGDLVVLSGGGQGNGRRGGSRRATVARRLGRPDVARDVIEALMLDRGLRARFDPAVEREARCRPRRRVRRAGHTLPAGPARPARAADVHDRPGHRARLRRRDLGGGRRRRLVARVGAHRRRRRATSPRARWSTARPTGAAPASTCPARSSRCCRARCPTTPARWCRARTRARSRSRWSSAARGAARLDLPLGDPLRRAARLRPVDRIFAGAERRRRAVGRAAGGGAGRGGGAG